MFRCRKYSAFGALLERHGVRVELVFTRGFRDSYLIGYRERVEMYDLRV